MANLFRRKKICLRNDKTHDEGSGFVDVDICDSLYPVSIAGGRCHLLVLSDDNSIWVKGDGKNGQLGLGSDVTSVDHFTKFPPISNFLPARHARRSNGFTLSRDGNNKSKATSWNRDTGTQETVSSIHSGPLTSAIITTSGRLLIWGYTYGKDIFTPVVVPLWDSWKVKSIQIGTQHILILVDVKKKGKTSSIVLSWGKSSAGALGHGDGVKIITQPTHLKIFDDLNPIQIFAGFSSSGALMENGDIYLWGTYGKFSSWKPKRVEVPHPGQLHSLYMSNECWVLHKGGNLYCFTKKSSAPEFVRVKTFDALKYGVFTHIGSEGRNVNFLNHRGQLYYSEGDQFTDSSILQHITSIGFVEQVICADKCLYILSDVPLILQGVDRVTRLQSGNYSVPRLILDVNIYFNGKEDKEICECDYSMDIQDDMEVLNVYNTYIENSATDLSLYAPPIVFQVLLNYLKDLTEPLIFASLIPSLVHKFQNAIPIYQGITYIQDMLQDESLKAAKGVLQHSFNIVNRCLCLKNTSIADYPALYEIFFSCMFGQVSEEYESVLNEILSIILQFTNLWYSQDLGIVPIQLHVISLHEDKLSLLDMFIGEQETSKEEEALGNFLISSPIIKKIIDELLKSSERDEAQLCQLENILNLLINNSSIKTYLDFLKQPKIITNDKQRNTITSLIHLACANNKNPKIAETIAPIFSQLP